MIDYQQNMMDNVFTTGFETTQPGPLSLAVAAGTFSIIQGKRVMDESGDFQTVRYTEEDSFPAFELDIVPDDDLAVVYDIYLLDEENEDGINIHVDRTELVFNEAPFYSGSTPLLHTLASIQVPPGTADLANVPILVRLVGLRED